MLFNELFKDVSLDINNSNNICTNKVKIELNYSADNYFSLIYEKICNL